jgi:hypothetical protein
MSPSARERVRCPQHLWKREINGTDPRLFAAYIFAGLTPEVYRSATCIWGMTRNMANQARAGSALILEANGCCAWGSRRKGWASPGNADERMILVR